MNKQLITASEARKISGPSVDDHLKFIELKIRAAAEKKAHEVIIRQEPYASWLYGNDRSQLAKQVISTLEKHGFGVCLYYAENQFVDMGLWIKWGD